MLRSVVKSPSLEVFRRHAALALGDSGGLGNMGLTAGLGSIKGLFQP